jgi:DNA ligase-1
VDRFARLYRSLDETNKTNEKVAALVEYFRVAPAADAAWATYLLCGRKLRQIIPVRRLAAWAAEASGVPAWLFDECYESVGDLAETVSLLLPPAEAAAPIPLSVFIEHRLIPLRNADEQQQRLAMGALWRTVGEDQRLVMHKLLTGGFRVGVSQRLVTRALARAAGVAAEVIAHRLTGEWKPTATWYTQLTSRDEGAAQPSRPYPFFLSHPLEGPPDSLGDVRGWQAEWKWDGIRAQLLCRAGERYVWSRGDELMSNRFPEIVSAGRQLPNGTVLDGEILAWRDGVLPFAVMQKRIGRKKLTPKVLADVPVVLMAFDLLEDEGRDVRAEPLSWRRSRLEFLLVPLASQARPAILLSPTVTADSWSGLARIRQESRRRNTEGLMLKRLGSGYGVGRPRGDWWKWKIEPFTIDAVLVYAQAGSGRRANLFTDYTFAVWHAGDLVPFAKAYSGLTDDEISQVDAFVRRNTRERFGPVRSVRPELVFEIAFENIRRSARHKSGVAVRFPRIARWRRDKSASQADSLDTLLSMIGGK